MKTPYELLDVAPDAGDAEIKRAYLQKVKDNPPDRTPEQFQIFHNAYVAIKDYKSRAAYALFHVPATDFDTLLNLALDTMQTTRFDPQPIEKLLRTAIDDQTLLNALFHSDKK